MVSLLLKFGVLVCVVGASGGAYWISTQPVAPELPNYRSRCAV